MEANKRIDAGIKRGPKASRTSVPRRRDPATGKVQAIPPDLDPQEVLARYLSEDTTSQIAASYGISRKSMISWLREVAPKDWKRVQLIRAHDRKDLSNEQIEDSTDPLSLARARELLKSSQWELTSLDPDYQPKQSVTIHPGAPVAPELLVNAIELLGQIRNPNNVIEQSNPEDSKDNIS